MLTSSTIPAQHRPTPHHRARPPLHLAAPTLPAPVQYPIHGQGQWVGELWLDSDGLALDCRSTNALTAREGRALAAEILARCDQMDASHR